MQSTPPDAFERPELPFPVPSSGSDTANWPPARPAVRRSPTGLTADIEPVPGVLPGPRISLELDVVVGDDSLPLPHTRFDSPIGIGRALDNAVQLSGDDTVHRYHVDILPGRGSDWFVEVSPNAVNRTVLNGKALLPGARYWLPPSFELELGKDTLLVGWCQA